jgi:hypothetical protein
MRTWPIASSLLILSFTLACGGPSEPAASPEAPAESGDPVGAAPEGEGDASKPEAAGEGDKPAAASSGAPASEDEVNAILQLVVDDPELDKHLHMEEPGRFPLQVSGDKLPSSLKLVKATKPVSVVAAPKSKKDAVLVFTEIEVQGDKATVRYRYDIEGVRGTVTLAKSPHGWELKNSRVVEHKSP